MGQDPRYKRFCRCEPSQQRSANGQQSSPQNQTRSANGQQSSPKSKQSATNGQQSSPKNQTKPPNDQHSSPESHGTQILAGVGCGIVILCIVLFICRQKRQGSQEDPT